LYTRNDILALNEMMAMIDINKYSQVFWEAYLELVEILKTAIEKKQYKCKNSILEVPIESRKFLSIFVESMALRTGMSLNAFHLRTWKYLKGITNKHDFITSK
jgi:hypothetical protein